MDSPVRRAQQRFAQKLDQAIVSVLTVKGVRTFGRRSGRWLSRVNMENLSAVLYGANDLRVEHHPPIEPTSKEVQIRVEKCGVCTTDVHLLDQGGLGYLVVKDQPIVLGHEYGGVVVAVGSDVTNVKPGHRVTVESMRACGQCPQCKRGHCNLCDKHLYIGFPPGGRGGLTRLATVPANIVHIIPESLDFEEAAMMEPLSVCVNAVKRADVTMGEDVIVFGAGPIGLMTLQVARASGASRVCVIDTSEERLKLARELGATHSVLFRADETDARANAQKIQDTLGGSADSAIECSGASVCLQTSIYAVRAAGVVAVVGFGDDDVTIPIVDAALREIDIRGCVNNNYGFPTAIKLVASQKVKVKPIISHRFRLEDIHTAFDLVRQHGLLKGVIDCASS